MQKADRKRHSRGANAAVTRAAEGRIAVRLPRSEPLQADENSVAKTVETTTAEGDPELQQLQEEYRRLCTLHRQLLYACKLGEEAAAKQRESYQVRRGLCEREISGRTLERHQARVSGLMFVDGRCEQSQLLAGWNLVSELDEAHQKRKQERTQEQLLRKVDHNIEVLVRRLVVRAFFLS